MRESFKIKLITNGGYRTTAYNFIVSLMQNKFICPTKQPDSDIIIKGFCEGNNVYLNIQMKTELYYTKDKLIEDLTQKFKSEDFELEFAEVCSSFF